MFNRFWIVAALFVGLHGLIHLMGFFAYWPLVTIPAFAYKTTILAGQLELDAVGMRAFSILWLVPALGFMATSIAMIGRWPRWQSDILVVTLISILITLLDWKMAFGGTMMNVFILIAFQFAPQTIKLIPVRRG